MEKIVNFIKELRGVLEKYDAAIVMDLPLDAENENDHKCIPKTHSKNGDITAKDLY